MCTRPSLSVRCCSLSSHSFSLLLFSSARAVCCLCREASSCRCFSRLRCFSCSISELGLEVCRDKDVQEEERSLRACRWSSMKLSCWTTTAWNRHNQSHRTDRLGHFVFCGVHDKSKKKSFTELHLSTLIWSTCIHCIEAILPAECWAEGADWRHCGGPAVGKQRSLSIWKSQTSCCCASSVVWGENCLMLSYSFAAFDFAC